MQLRDFDFNLLVTFEAIWTTRSVSAAAKTLNLAQSTVSASLNRLRITLDDKLFTWSGSEMTPSPLAEQIIPDITQLLNGGRSIITKSRGQVDTIERQIVIATLDYVAALLGADLITKAAVEAPQLSLHFVDNLPTSINRFTRPDVDLFLIPSNVFRITGMERLPLYRDRYVCIAAADNGRLYEGMSPNAFIALHHVGFSAIPRVALNHETTLWDERGEDIHLRLTMKNYLIFAPIVANSDAVALLPSRLAATLCKHWDLKIVKPPLPMPELEITATWRPELGRDVSLTWVRDTIADITASWTRTAALMDAAK